ncbi:MAG: CPBP family intramembrane glutamic endopeptidase [Alphaproteobacteria bacterium]
MDIKSSTPPDSLAAWGSLAPHAIGPRRARLWIEFALLFVVMPAAVTYLVRTLRVPLIFLLLIVLIGLVAFLLWDRTFSLKRELSRGIAMRELKSIAAIFLGVAAIMAVYVWFYEPARFLSFPRRSLLFWGMVMLLYPLLSAFPQELVYRTFYFHRYGALFNGSRGLAVGINGALFGLAHIMMGSAFSVVLSGALGVLLAFRYTHARSFWAALLEHSLYGQLVFTIGLGYLFFTGNSVVPR